MRWKIDRIEVPSPPSIEHLLDTGCNDRRQYHRWFPYMLYPADVSSYPRLINLFHPVDKRLPLDKRLSLRPIGKGLEISPLNGSLRVNLHRLSMDCRWILASRSGNGAEPASPSSTGALRQAWWLNCVSRAIRTRLVTLRSSNSLIKGPQPFEAIWG